MSCVKFFFVEYGKISFLNPYNVGHSGELRMWGWGRKVRKEEKKKEIMKTFCVILFRFCSQINRLTKCDICTALKDEKQKTLDKGLRAYFDQLYKYHNDLQM